MTKRIKSFDDEAWALFEDDAQGSLQKVEEGLLALEHDPEDRENLNDLFRGLHTLKGSSGFLGLTALTRLAHAAEDLVGLIRDGEVPLSDAAADALLGALDVLRLIVTESRDGHVEEHLDLIAPHCEQLQALTGPKSRAPISFTSLIDASEAIHSVLLQSQPDPSSADEVRRKTEALIDGLKQQARALVLEPCLRRIDDLERALREEESTSWELHWLLVHRLVVADSSAGAVFFDEQDAEHEQRIVLADASALRVFLDTMLELLAELVTSLRARSGNQRPASRIVAEILNDCRAMALDEVADLVEQLLEPALPEDPSLDLIELRFDPVLRRLMELQERWAIMTGLRQDDEDAFLELVRQSWERTTQPAEHTVVHTQRDGDARWVPTPSFDIRAPEGKASSATSEQMSSIGGEQLIQETVPPRRLSARPRPSNDLPAVPRQAVAPSDARRQTKFIRVEVEKIEHLMALAGEIGLAAGSVFSLPAFQSSGVEGLQSRMDMVEGLIRELQDTSAGLALIPVSNVFNRMNRLARDLAHQTGKKFQLLVRGGETEIDKSLVDALHDPLVHLIRNAVDHGLESPEERSASGKNEVAQVVLAARHQGDSVHIIIRDDGRGMNRRAILDKAVHAGILAPEQGEAMDDAAVWDLVFEPGFSTAESVSDLSGRGIGMDVVRTTIQSQRGQISIRSTPGRGTVVQLKLPLTLAFLDAMIIRIRESFYVLPVSTIHRVFRVEQDEVVSVKSEGVDLIAVDEDLVPALPLEELFEHSAPTSLEGRLVVVVQTAKGRMAIPIDELVGQEQVTMKPLQGHLANIRGGAACGLLRNGEVAIALDCDRLREMMRSDAAQ